MTLCFYFAATSVQGTRILRDNMYGCLNKTAIKRLAARGGVGRMSSLVPEEIRASLKVHRVESPKPDRPLNLITLSIGNFANVCKQYIIH